MERFVETILETKDFGLAAPIHTIDPTKTAPQSRSGVETRAVFAHLISAKFARIVTAVNMLEMRDETCRRYFIQARTRSLGSRSSVRWVL
jgi:hypothetical protein